VSLAELNVGIIGVLGTLRSAAGAALMLPIRSLGEHGSPSKPRIGAVIHRDLGSEQNLLVEKSLLEKIETLSRAISAKQIETVRGAEW
jgi:hypothetical protein